MKHYDITIIGAKSLTPAIACELKNNYKILLVDQRPIDTINNSISDKNIDIATSTKYRNKIKTDDGYILILYHKRKNIQISTNTIIRIE